MERFLCFFLSLSFGIAVQAKTNQISIAQRLSALQNLIDEYANSFQRDEMRAAIERINEVRAESEPGFPGTFSASKDMILEERGRIKNLVRLWRKKKRPLFPNEINGETLQEKQVILTFDDGPSPEFTAPIEKILKKNKAPGAFFQVGENVYANPQLTQSLAKNGFLLANHTWDHTRLTTLNNTQVHQEIILTQEVIQFTLGGERNFSEYFEHFFAKAIRRPLTMSAPHFVRSPYGSRNERTLKIINEISSGFFDNDKNQKANLIHVMWNIDSLDWKDPDPKSIEDRVFKILEVEGRRGIILFHDIHPQTVAAVQKIIPRLKKEGYALIGLYDLLNQLSAPPSL